MKEIIAVSQSKMEEGWISTVNARDLHTFIGVKKDFSNWIKDRIEKYGFTEGVDYVTISRSPIQASGNRGASIDYHLTLDMAKELSMVERNEKGKQARLYFLECEKVAKQQAQLFSPIAGMIAMLNEMDAMRSRLLAMEREAAPVIARLRAIRNIQASTELTMDERRPITGSTTAKEAAAIWGCSQATAKRHLRRLANSGLLQEERPKNPNRPHVYTPKFLVPCATA